MISTPAIPTTSQTQGYPPRDPDFLFVHSNKKEAKNALRPYYDQIPEFIPFSPLHDKKFVFAPSVWLNHNSRIQLFLHNREKSFTVRFIIKLSQGYWSVKGGGIESVECGVWSKGVKNSSRNIAQAVLNHQKPPRHLAATKHCTRIPGATCLLALWWFNLLAATSLWPFVYIKSSAATAAEQCEVSISPPARGAEQFVSSKPLPATAGGNLVYKTSLPTTVDDHLVNITTQPAVAAGVLVKPDWRSWSWRITVIYWALSISNLLTLSPIDKACEVFKAYHLNILQFCIHANCANQVFKKNSTARMKCDAGMLHSSKTTSLNGRNRSRSRFYRFVLFTCLAGASL